MVCWYNQIIHKTIFFIFTTYQDNSSIDYIHSVPGSQVSPQKCQYRITGPGGSSAVQLRGTHLLSGLAQGYISSLKMRALEQINNRSIYVLERGMPRGHPGDQQHVPSARDGRQATTDCFPHESLDPVAKHCFANLATHRERKTALGAIVGRLDQNKQPVVPRSSLLSQHPDLCAVSQAVWFS
jgi:hypothetical protein